jgi:coproporphyrinogen III oxidase-like Fe-S oxidoreductase
LGDEERRLETLYLGLRTSDGVSLSAIPDTGGGVLEDASRSGLLEISGQTVRATPWGWLTLDDLVTRLTT